MQPFPSLRLSRRLCQTLGRHLLLLVTLALALPAADVLQPLLAPRSPSCDAPLNLAAEVQLIYQPYLDQGRKLSHLPYKVVRCESASELARDAGGKKQSEEVRAKVDAAERACMDVVLAELAAHGQP